MEKELQKITANVLNCLGRWVNTYDKGRVIGEITLFENNGELLLSASGTKNGYRPGDWGTVPVRYYSYGPDTDDVVAFLASFDLEEMEALLTINENRGLLIIAGYFTFKSDGRSDYYVREFYHKM